MAKQRSLIKLENVLVNAAARPQAQVFGFAQPLLDAVDAVTEIRERLDAIERGQADLAGAVIAIVERLKQSELQSGRSGEFMPHGLAARLYAIYDKGHPCLNP